MRWISSAAGVLCALDACHSRKVEADPLVTGLAAVDELLPGQHWRKGNVHEVLGPSNGALFPLLVVRQAMTRGAIVWCDPAGELYLPAVAAMGVSLDRLILLQPRSPQEALWAISECLRCKGVAACVARVEKLSMLDARRLQLAAECGGGVGLLLRPASAIHQPYAAATRWIVRPQPGERTVHRWTVQLIHGHGGRVGESVILEVGRDTNLVRASKAVADRSSAPATKAITA